VQKASIVVARMNWRRNAPEALLSGFVPNRIRLRASLYVTAVVRENGLLLGNPCKSVMSFPSVGPSSAIWTAASTLLWSGTVTEFLAKMAKTSYPICIGFALCVTGVQTARSRITNCESKID